MRKFLIKAAIALVIMMTAPAAVYGFDPGEHPRAGKGSPGGVGGQFVTGGVQRPSGGEQGFGLPASAAFANEIKRHVNSAPSWFRNYSLMSVDKVVAYANVQQARANLGRIFIPYDAQGMYIPSRYDTGYGSSAGEFGRTPAVLAFIESNMSGVSEDERRHIVYYEMAHALNAGADRRKAPEPGKKGLYFSDQAPFQEAFSKDRAAARAAYAAADAGTKRAMDGYSQYFSDPKEAYAEAVARALSPSSITATDKANFSHLFPAIEPLIQEHLKFIERREADERREGERLEKERLEAQKKQEEQTRKFNKEYEQRWGQPPQQPEFKSTEEWEREAKERNERVQREQEESMRRLYEKIEREKPSVGQSEQEKEEQRRKNREAEKRILRPR